MVLLRIDGNRVERVRSLAPDCDIDAGGVPLHWLSGVTTGESVALLGRLAAANQGLGDSALTAIALHAGAAADAALESLAAAGQPEWLRRKAVERLAAWRGRRGFETVRHQLTAAGEDDRLRERAVQSLARSREPEAVDLLISLARRDPSSGVRRQAMNTLAHTRDPRAFQFFEEVLAVKR
jgi:HEAT repeat protein